jgi:hypothetical protein
VSEDAKMRLPSSEREWQEAVDLAEWGLCVDSARKYGLIKGGAEFNLERCERILRLGAGLGYRPAGDAAARLTVQFMRGSGEGTA